MRSRRSSPRRSFNSPANQIDVQLVNGSSFIYSGRADDDLGLRSTRSHTLCGHGSGVHADAAVIGDVQHLMHQVKHFLYRDAVHASSCERVFHGLFHVEDADHDEARDDAEQQTEAKVHVVRVVRVHEVDVVRAVEDRQHQDKQPRERPSGLRRPVELWPRTNASEKQRDALGRYREISCVP